MIHTERTVRTLQAVAMSVGIALLLWSTGLPTLFRFAEAASITDASDTITSSVPSQVANHTITFTTPNGLIPTQTISLTFEGTFTMGSIVENDVDLLVGGVSTSTVSGAASSGNWGVVVAGSVITFEAPPDAGVASSTEIVIRIGTNAVDFGTGANRITNPSATTTSHYIDIGGTMQDSGQIRIAIVDEVMVSADVDTSFQFSVAGVASGQTVNSSPTTTATGTTPATLPFGTLPNDGSTVVLAHDLSVSTNAANGYTVTVEQTGELQSTTGAIIDGFIDGSYTTTPSAWQAPTGLVSNPATYGHWGLTSEDPLVAARSSQFGSDQWVSASGTPIAITGHGGPVLATTTRIGYQVQITALQEAGDDYATELRYIATPVF